MEKWIMKIEQWFPIHIGYVYNPFHKEIEDDLTQQCLKIKKTYKKDSDQFQKEEFNNLSSSQLLNWYQFQKHKISYMLLKDQKFSRLHDWIDSQINIYTKQLKFTVSELKCNEGWFNVYEKHEFTDYHNHAPNAVSCVYFLNCTNPQSGAKLLVKNNHEDLTAYTDLVPSYICYDPNPGKLVVFSSYLDHGVQQHNTNDLRITLSYNYV